MRAAIGLRAHSGWAALVTVAGTPESPSVVDRRRVVLAGPDDPKQPYHEAENLGLSRAQELLRRASHASRRLAARGLAAAIADAASEGHDVSACGLLLASGRALPGLAETLASHALIHTADGEHFRDALRHAAADVKVPVTAVREKEIWERASAELFVPIEKLKRTIALIGKSLGPPWTEDQKLATLVAWTALAAPKAR